MSIISLFKCTSLCICRLLSLSLSAQRRSDVYQCVAAVRSSCSVRSRRVSLSLSLPLPLPLPLTFPSSSLSLSCCTLNANGSSDD